MRKVFSSNEPSETALVRDALVHHGVAVTIQNEHSGRSAVPAFRPPAELWVRRDDDDESARRIVIEMKLRNDALQITARAELGRHAAPETAS